MNTEEFLAKERLITIKHECGHAVICHHFKLRFFAKHRLTDENRWTGICYHPQTTPFRTAVIAWGGIIGEYYNETYIEGIESLAVAIESLAVGVDDWLYVLDENHESDDAQCILNHPQRWRSCTLAVSIFLKHFDLWQRMVQFMDKFGHVERANVSNDFLHRTEMTRAQREASAIRETKELVKEFSNK